MVVKHDDRNACGFEDADALRVVFVLRAVDEHDVGFERENFFTVENVVVIAPDAWFGHQLRECLF